MSDWEYSDESCPKCASQLAWQRCNHCDAGVWEDDDGINGIEYIPCDNCNGRGRHEWCRECGWDEVEKRFLSPHYEEEFLRKQKAA